MIAKNLPNVMKDIKVQGQEAQRMSYRTNTRKSTPRTHHSQISAN